MISALEPQWCQTTGVVDDAGKPVIKPNGTQFYTYELHQLVINASATPSQQSKVLIYSDASLQGARWKLLPGVSVLDMNLRTSRGGPPCDKGDRTGRDADAWERRGLSHRRSGRLARTTAFP